MLKDKQLKQVVKQLKGASKMHAQQAKKIQKHIDAMKKPKMQKRETQAELDKRFENFVKQSLGARGFNDKGELSYPPSYEKLRKTRFNREWRDNLIKDAMHTKELNRKVDSVRNVSQKMYDANRVKNKPKMLRNKFKNYC